MSCRAAWRWTCSYVGSRTRGLPVSKGINEITAEQLATGAFMLQPVPNPYQGLLPGTPFNGATVPRQQLVRPYSQFASITEDRRPFGVNDYDALQISVNKRMSSGLQFLVSYTYSRTEEEVTYLNPQDDWGQLTRVVTAADSPHRLLVSSTYELPFFKDQEGVMGSLFGGWQMNGIVTFQSGLPVATTAGAFLVGDPTIENPTLARWFNTCTQALSGARQNCASADEPIAWQVQPPFTLRTLTTRLEDVRTERPVSHRLLAVQDVLAAAAHADPAAARVVQPVQHAVVRRAEHQRDQRRIRHGRADAGERSTQRPDRHPVHVLTRHQSMVGGCGLCESAARSLDRVPRRISSTVRLSPSPSHSEQKGCLPPRRRRRLRPLFSFGARPASRPRAFFRPGVPRPRRTGEAQVPFTRRLRRDPCPSRVRRG